MLAIRPIAGSFFIALSLLAYEVVDVEDAVRMRLLTRLFVIERRLVGGVLRVDDRHPADERRILAGENLRREESFGAILLTPFPPDRILTARGRLRARVGKVIIGTLSLSIAILAIRIVLSR